MFATFAKTFFRASGVSGTTSQDAATRTWYRDELSDQPAPKRWEDWR
ncbi:MAG: hypothetical protein MRY75_01060 [Marivita sp.]|nr:hypothetical protein [Marivita sp.]MCI5109115.1 hypothetical protein [Marivita sp.]